ncbi:hypothetical protein LSAT2_010533 [Lamellibrachia satsuma]|nr:hypothetical protein LSAT2_010533 [Lamellibrachia satsuma]
MIHNRNTTQHNATQRNATQRNATQRNTPQHNATQHNATQRKTIVADGSSYRKAAQRRVEVRETDLHNDEALLWQIVILLATALLTRTCSGGGIDPYAMCVKTCKTAFGRCASRCLYGVNPDVEKCKIELEKCLDFCDDKFAVD